MTNINMNYITDNNELVIGKHLLESITVGLYKDPYVIYREYIQNSLDAIDNAIEDDIIKPEENEVLVEVLKKSKTVRILDNGTGIKHSEIFFTLASIGASSKDIDKNRGFRGIGRLSGLGYCAKIRFVTSASNENIKTEIAIDADSIRASFNHKKSKENLRTLMSNAITINKSDESLEAHYFEVVLEGVNDKSLLNINDIKLYLAEFMPVPFDEIRFRYNNKINMYLVENGINNKAYNILVSNGISKTRIYKLYHDKFRVNISGSETDELSDISVQKLYFEDGEYLGWFWFGKCKFLGTVTDEKIKGIRLKKDGITIGDRFSINKLFKEERFNGWLQGEIHFNNRNLIPNSSRDDFEQNDTYDKAKRIIKNRIDEICDSINGIASSRNKKIKTNKSRVIENSSIIASMDQLVNEIAYDKKNRIEKALSTEYKAEEVKRIIDIIYKAHESDI